jgi:hypothetical protein
LVSVAVAVAFWDVRASAIIDFAWTVAGATCIDRSYAWVFVVANAIAVCIGVASSSALSYCVGSQAGAVIVCGSGVEVACKGVGAPGHLIGIADSVLVGIGSTVPAAYPQGIGKQARTVISCSTVTVVACAGIGAPLDLEQVLKVVTNAILIRICAARTTAYSDRIQLIPVAVTISRWNVGTTALIDGARTIADSAGIN